MGYAFAAGLLSKGIVTADALAIIEKNPERRDFLAEKTGAVLFKELDEIRQDYTVFLLAIKPQDADTLFSTLNQQITKGSLVISIMAGVTLATMESGLPSAEIIRAMPNTPAGIREGMSVYFGKDLSPDTTTTVETILGAVGKIVRVTSESMIDAATAISGSGPAYLFYLAESMVEGAIGMGFSKTDAELLTLQTLFGASSLLQQSNTSAAELRKAVTSPGGTTAAAIGVFDERHIKESLIDAFGAALRRAKELGES